MSATSRQLTNRTTVALVLGALAVGSLAADRPSAAPAAKSKQQSQAITVGADEFPPVLNNMTTPQGNGRGPA